jgi:deoxycytidylate deaminase
MKKSAAPTIDDQLHRRGELILGLVAPVGTDLGETLTALQERLRLSGYSAAEIRLSHALKLMQLKTQLQEEPEVERLKSYMTAGTEARSTSNRADILALAAIGQINQSRPDNKGPAARPGTAHILLTLKHPEEVRTLRRVYGPGFFLIGISSSKADRIRYLVETKGITQRDAEDLVQLDESEEQSNDTPRKLGQQTRDTFQLADVFVSQGDKSNIYRFLDLVFGDPFQTPTQEEQAMFMAYASSLRSADLSRQVGAVILSEHGDLIATGANDVAAPGGGLYWPGEHDARDFRLGKDINEQRRNEFVLDTMKRLFPNDNRSEKELLRIGKERLEGSPIFDITEFGRAVHAEMEALIACARSGVSPRNGMLVCTTFPCHNCAKHIVAAGLALVIYVEPYPKSQAYDLFSDAIVLSDLIERKNLNMGNQVLFAPFVGIGPRRYFDLFSLGLSSGYKIKRKADGGLIVGWKRETGQIRVPMPPNSYLDRETEIQRELVALTEGQDATRHKKPSNGRGSAVLGSGRNKGKGGRRVARMEKVGRRKGGNGGKAPSATKTAHRKRGPR